MSDAALGRRRLLAGCLCCAAAPLLEACAPPPEGGRLAPNHRPAMATTEGGLWRVMEQQESRLRDSPALVRDLAVTRYVTDLACRLAGEHCADIRVYVVRTPAFNASMAPNGMMQVWTGLLLRVHNEAQLAAIIGHEIGHYLRRHTLDRYEAMRNSADIAAFLSLGMAAAGVGVAAPAAQLALVAGALAFSREQEREADSIGLHLMHRAGFAPDQAAMVWDNLIAEAAASRAVGARDPIFATHPRSADRAEALRAEAAGLAAGTAELGAERHRAALAGLRLPLLQDEVRLRQPERSLDVFARAEAAGLGDAPLFFARGEVLRLRDAEADRPQALLAYRRATALPGAPAEAWRGIGLVLRREGDAAGAREAFEQYLVRAPQAADAALMRSYIQTLGS